jgi:hypothetical protein
LEFLHKNKERGRPGPVEEILGGEPPPFLEGVPIKIRMKTQIKRPATRN